MTHDEAIEALCGCAATVTLLSYQEAIEGYFKLRGLTIPTSEAAPVGEDVRERVVERLREAVPDLFSVISWFENGCDVAHGVTELKIYQSRIDAALTGGSDHG